jgi:hypothetical protein
MTARLSARSRSVSPGRPLPLADTWPKATACRAQYSRMKVTSGHDASKVLVRGHRHHRPGVPVFPTLTTV